MAQTRKLAVLLIALISLLALFATLSAAARGTADAAAVIIKPAIASAGSAAPAR